MKIKLLILMYFLSVPFMFSQVKLLEVNSKRNSDNSVQFSYKSRYQGSLYLTVTLKQLNNTANAKIERRNIRGSGSLFKLKPLDAKKGISYSYSYSYIKGKAVKKVDEQFVYSLPFKMGSEVMAYDMGYLGEKFGNKAPKNWKSIQFVATINDSIYAARKGIVVDVVNEFDADQSGDYRFNSKSNYILVEHKDGSIAKYGVLKKNSIVVKKGQTVYPQTVMAQAGTFDKPENCQLRFSVYYIDKTQTDKKSSKKETLANKRHLTAYVNPIFLLTEGKGQLVSGESYDAIVNDDLIEEEMSKREKKKRKN